MAFCFIECSACAICVVWSWRPCLVTRSHLLAVFSLPLRRFYPPRPPVVPFVDVHLSYLGLVHGLPEVSSAVSTPCLGFIPGRDVSSPDVPLCCLYITHAVTSSVERPVTPFQCNFMFLPKCMYTQCLKWDSKSKNCKIEIICQKSDIRVPDCFYILFKFKNDTWARQPLNNVYPKQILPLTRENCPSSVSILHSPHGPQSRQIPFIALSSNRQFPVPPLPPSICSTPSSRQYG